MEERKIKGFELPKGLPLLVSYMGLDGRPNILTVAAYNVVSLDPFRIMIYIKPHKPDFSYKQYSFFSITQNKEFVINIAPHSLASEVDICGSVSGEKYDKFATTGLTPVKSRKVLPPLIKECPVSLECRVYDIHPSGGIHHAFSAEVVAKHVQKKLIKGKTKREINFELLNPILFAI